MRGIASMTYSTPLLGESRPNVSSTDWPPTPKSVLVEVRINKREIWHSVWDDVDLGCRDVKDFLEKLRRMLTHNDDAIGEFCQFDHYAMLVRIRFTENRMKGGHNRHAESGATAPEYGFRLARQKFRIHAARKPDRHW